MTFWVTHNFDHHMKHQRTIVGSSAYHSPRCSRLRRRGNFFCSGENGHSTVQMGGMCRCILLCVCRQWIKEWQIFIEFFKCARGVCHVVIHPSSVEHIKRVFVRVVLHRTDIPIFCGSDEPLLTPFPQIDGRYAAAENSAKSSFLASKKTDGKVVAASASHAAIHLVETAKKMEGMMTCFLSGRSVALFAFDITLLL